MTSFARTPLAAKVARRLQRTAKPPEQDKKPAAPAPEASAAKAEKEFGGRDGPDPVRYGDWEKGGIAVDF
jgi:hypothetical protein